jgi:membrane protein
VLRGIRGAFSRFGASDGFFLSAGLAFFFLVTLIPLVLIGVSMVGFVLSTRQAEDVVIGQLAQNFPVYKRDIAATLQRIVETRRVSGVLGTIALIFFATPLFSASRLVLDRLVGVRGDTSFIRHMVLDMALVLLLCALLFLATGVTWVYQWVLIFVLRPAGMPSTWIGAASTALSLVFAAGLFYLAYRFVPHQRIRPRAALAGALTGALLLEVARQLFRLYIRAVGMYDQIYGALGVLVAVVMFVYYAAIVFVFGAAYAAALDARRRR